VKPRSAFFECNLQKGGGDRGGDWEKPRKGGVQEKGVCFGGDRLRGEIEKKSTSRYADRGPDEGVCEHPSQKGSVSVGGLLDREDEKGVSVDREGQRRLQKNSSCSRGTPHLRKAAGLSIPLARQKARRKSHFLVWRIPGKEEEARSAT